jgi:hypothetical protein
LSAFPRTTATTPSRSPPSAYGCAPEAAPADVQWRAAGRSPENAVGGWYVLKKSLRGSFGVYVPPLLEALGRAELELEHNPRNNRMRAV